MSNEERIKNMWDLITAEGGNPEYVVIAGLGEMYWPSLSETERAFALGYRQGWIERRKHIDEGRGW